MTEPVALEYAKGHSPWPRRVWCGIVLLMALSIGAGGWHWRQDILQHARAWYWQRQCAHFTLPPGEIMVESNYAGAAKLLADRPLDYAPIPDGAKRVIPAATHLDGALSSAPGVSRFSRTIFVHELTAAAAGSKPRLVMVEFDATPFRPLPAFDVRVLSKGSLFRLPAHVGVSMSSGMELNLGHPRDAMVRIYAGQPDPGDPSHFTIDYELWGQRDTFDGWLQADDEVKFKPRKRPVPPATASAGAIR